MSPKVTPCVLSLKCVANWFLQHEKFKCTDTSASDSFIGGAEGRTSKLLTLCHKLYEVSTFQPGQQWCLVVAVHIAVPHCVAFFNQQGLVGLFGTATDDPSRRNGAGFNKRDKHEG